MSKVEDVKRVNLKGLLMILGNRLVMEKGFDPAGPRPDPFYAGSTGAIACFTDWVNRNPEAQDLLKELGMDWPMVVHQDKIGPFSKALFSSGRK